MKIKLCRAILFSSIILGISTTIHLVITQLVSMTIVVYFVNQLFFKTHADAWWYNLVPFIVLTGIALTGTGIFALICEVLPFTGITTHNCQSLDISTVLKWHVYVLNFGGGLLWSSFCAIIWLHKRKH